MCPNAIGNWLGDVGIEACAIPDLETWIMRDMKKLHSCDLSFDVDPDKDALSPLYSAWCRESGALHPFPNLDITSSRTAKGPTDGRLLPAHKKRVVSVLRRSVEKVVKRSILPYYCSSRSLLWSARSLQMPAIIKSKYEYGYDRRTLSAS